MEHHELKAIVENLLLASDHPVTPEQLAQTFLDGTDKGVFRDVLREIGRYGEIIGYP